MPGATLFEKIWHSHVVRSFGERWLIHIDRHFVHEGTSRNAFDGLRQRGQGVRNLELTFGVIDHDPSTLPGRTAQTYAPSRERIGAMQENCREFGLHLFDVDDPQQGIVHVIATEHGIVLPGMTVVCGDSHTATNGGVGAWGWGIGTTEVERVLATQTLLLPKPKTMRANFGGRLSDGVTSKDLILYLIGQHGVGDRHRLCGRICRAGDPRAADRGAADRLQHVDRVRRALRDDRARRYDHPVLRRASLRAHGRALGAGGCPLARAADRRRRGVRPRNRHRLQRGQPAGHLGDLAAGGHRRRRADSRSVAGAGRNGAPR